MAYTLTEEDKVELVKVVQIRSGQTIDAVIEDLDYGSRMWRPESLKKNGGFPRNRYADGYMLGVGVKSLHHWALYSSKRELQAQPIREHIKSLREQIEHVEMELLALY